MIKKIYSLLILSLCLGFISCNDNEDDIDPSSSAPVIKFAFDDLQADMNKVDNLPVVAVIQSKAGLKKVTMKIQTTEGIINYKEVATFFNDKSYSLSEKLNFSPTYVSFIVEATDKLNREVSDTLSLGIVEVKEAPQIKFDPAMIEYDELEGGPMPITKFAVTSAAGLKKIEMFLITESGQNQYGFPVDFSNAEKEYPFEQQIMYKEGDKGFKVKATDIYGQVKIETLPVKYLTPAPPVVTLKADTIYADKNEVKTITMHIESQRGVKDVKIFRTENGTEKLIKTLDYPDKPMTLTIAPEVTFTNATSKVRILVTDNVNKWTEVSVAAIVNMEFVARLQMGSQPLANGYDKAPGVYALLSLKDMKTYSMEYALASADNAANLDLKFYSYGGSAVPRMYSIDGGNGTKSNEFKGKDGKTVIDMEVQNETKLLLLPDFDFENATAETIAGSIPSSTIVGNGINPYTVGSVLAFKTAQTSTSGGGRIGIMKILSDEQINPSNATSRVITVSIKFPRK